jgi:hypothetical protein
MSRLAPLRTALLVVPMVVPAGPLCASGERVDDMPRVITHTREYCEELSARAGQLRLAHGRGPAEAALLAAEGDRLCAQGQIRPGIMRLRRAIMLLRGDGSGPR